MAEMASFGNTENAKSKEKMTENERVTLMSDVRKCG